MAYTKKSQCLPQELLENAMESRQGITETVRDALGSSNQD
jgi:hypothetical protein